MKKLLLCLFSLFSLVAIGQEFQFTPITVSGTPGLTGIVDITGSGEGVSEKLYIVEKRGAIRIVQNNTIAAQEFFSFDSNVEDGGERGLLGLAFHPDFPTSRYFYVNYVVQGTITTRISRFTVPVGSPGNADENSELILLEFPGLETNHKAGDLAFGPDGYLYITTGDGGGGGDPGDNGQDINEWLGKILRINVDVPSGGLNYSSPPTNPFVGVAGLDEIYMIGLRNPWRLSFDRESGDLWIADVGQGLWEEVNMIPAGTGAGKNLGWNCKEGFHNFEPQHCVGVTLTSPIMEYRHCPDGTNQCGASITGGFVYRGNDYPDMYGKYIAVDFSTNDIWEITFPDSLSYESNGNSGITTFGEDDFGELFAGNLAGVLYRVTMGQPLAIQWESLIAVPVINGNRISWTLHDFMDVDYFEVQRSTIPDFNDYAKLIKITPHPDRISYSYDDPYFFKDDIVYYRVAAYMNDGTLEYSSVARIIPDPLSKPYLTFDFNNSMWRIAVPANWQNGDLILYDLQGRVVYKTGLDGRDHVDLSVPVPPGVYFISIRGIEGTWSDRIIR